MKLPKIEKPSAGRLTADKYVGLYVVDFGDNCGVGFTAEEVAELLESRLYGHCKAYKIHKAYPDGRLELKGVRREIFQLEAGMFFYSSDYKVARGDYKRLVKTGIETDVPCRATVQLAKYAEDKYVTALIYPAEYDDEISAWLLSNNYKTAGVAEGGTDVVSRYYEEKPEILARHQLWPKSSLESGFGKLTASRTGQELLANVKAAVQR